MSSLELLEGLGVNFFKVKHVFPFQETLLKVTNLLESQSVFILRFIPLNVQNNWDWARMKPRAKNPILISYVDGKDPCT